ncbi:MAG: PD-(D/E)XK nuclease family protein [Treponema sp.]|nr:PD-(D/E)XK nuclease family protein [Treponema sp.]
MVNVIEKAIKENILDKNSVFIFNTDIAANSWTDFIVRKDGNDGWPRSIALERFLAWDAFKGQALKSKDEGRAAIPSLLRKLFARGLLERIKGGEEFFERLINSDYKENALSFTDWISGLLPSLGRWRALADKFIKDGRFIGERDNPENRDLLRLYEEYSKFLDERGLFEPSWQKSRFDPSGEKKYVIFFPELLDDFDEYKEVLEEAQKNGLALLVHIPQEKEEIRADYWSSMRLELRIAALKILEAQKEGTDWNDMALCVPDIENLRPYVERELSLYKIPFWTRSGIKLGKSGAGRIFRKIQDCAQKSFSYQSVRSLVLDANIPWKDPQEMEILVRLGKEAKCLVQYTDNDGKLVDPWLLDLTEGAKKNSGENEFLNAKAFYKGLKDAARRMTEAKSFSAIKEGWKKFEEAFILPKDQIGEEANNILSRCVTLLDELADLEKDYPEIAKSRIESYSFFLNEIENTQYQTKQKKGGVSVFDYKVSAQAAIKKQFVMNASQNKITVQKIALNFLPPKERALLIDDKDSDHSEAYVRSYALCSVCSFSAAQKALDGFAIPHSALTANGKPLESDEKIDAKDFIKNESGLLTSEQKNSFEKYFERNKENESFDPTSEEANKEFLSAAIEEKSSEDKISITPSDLKDFFPCPRKWIFKRLLHVNEFSLDTDLFEIYDQGSVNHKILELYFAGLKESGQTLPVTDELTGKLAQGDGLDYEEKILLPLLEECAEQAFKEAKSYKQSALVQETLKSQNAIFAKTIIKFLRKFCDKEKFGGWKIQEVEWSGQTEIEPSALLQGRMDLALRSPQNETAIIDYKNTGSAVPTGDKTLKKAEPNPDGSPKELDDCQMAAYVRLWESANSGEGFTISRASFVTIKGCDETKVIAPPPPGRNAPLGNAVSRDCFDAALQSLERRTISMANALQEKSFTLKEVKRYKDCVKCKYNTICRTTY